MLSACKTECVGRQNFKTAWKVNNAHAGEVATDDCVLYFRGIDRAAISDKRSH